MNPHGYPRTRQLVSVLTDRHSKGGRSWFRLKVWAEGAPTSTAVSVGGRLRSSRGGGSRPNLRPYCLSRAENWQGACLTIGSALYRRQVQYHGVMHSHTSLSVAGLMSDRTEEQTAGHLAPVLLYENGRGICRRTYHMEVRKARDGTGYRTSPFTFFRVHSAHFFGK